MGVGAHGLGCARERLTRTMPCDRLRHQGGPAPGMPGSRGRHG
ncbi:hypothetical protein P376_5376 [Streptomyces sp. HCCB10043]|nr:hypothetical protein P376_5376 [Streptomyces sp. HCCB10043]